jgi:hypothetical protein
MAYGAANYERLAALKLKKKYDPHNFFRLNPNIKSVCRGVAMRRPTDAAWMQYCKWRGYRRTAVAPAIGDELGPRWLRWDDGLTRAPPRSQPIAARNRARSNAWPRRRK